MHNIQGTHTTQHQKGEQPSTKKMGRASEQTFSKEDTDGQLVHENMLN